MMKQTIITLITVLLLSITIHALDLKIVASDGGAINRFGHAVALEDNLLFVGAPGSFSDRDFRGAVYIYEQSNGDWLESQKLDMPEQDIYDFFGFSLAKSDSFAIISARGDSIRNPLGGVAFIYQQHDSGWALKQSLTSEQRWPTDLYGFCVDIDSAYAVVGAPSASGSLPGSMCGAVYIYKYEDNEWILDAQIYPQDAEVGLYFGCAVSLSGNRLIVGASGVDAQSGRAQKAFTIGRAYVYERDNTGWQHAATFAPQDGNAGNMFGAAVALNGDYAVVGAYQDDVLDFDTGSAYIYKKEETEWTEVIKLFSLDADSGDYFGAALDLYENYLVIGAPGVDGVGKNSGAVYSFLLGDEGWAQRTRKTPYDAEKGDSFGAAIALSEQLAAVGAPHKKVENRASQGAAYLYDNIADLALPVELTSFTAMPVQGGILLQWATQSEKDNLGFMLQRKMTDDAWQTIASFQTHEALRGQGSTSMPTFYEFADDSVQADATYNYRLGDVDISGIVTWHAPISVSTFSNTFNETVQQPKTLRLLPAFPNPFNPQTVLRYELPETANVRMTIFDMSGRRVKTLVSQRQTAGSYSYVWDGSNESGVRLSSGVYIVQLQAGNVRQSRQVVFLQ